MPQDEAATALCLRGASGSNKPSCAGELAGFNPPGDLCHPLSSSEPVSAMLLGAQYHPMLLRKADVACFALGKPGVHGQGVREERTGFCVVLQPFRTVFFFTAARFILLHGSLSSMVMSIK